MPFSAGDRVGPYEVISAIGKGGMGEVWKAHDPQLGRDVAIKVSAQQFTDRFEREARAIASLNHPNVCTIYHVGPNYLVLEYIEGPTLAERIAQGPIPLEEALGIAKQIANALEAAHEKSIVHRDLKPANIKIKPDGQVKVLDFGLAKSAAEETPLTPDSPTMLTVHGMILGTAGYMAPEQAAGQPVDKRADVWAFGVVLYEILTGQRLFQGDSVAHVLADVLRGPIDLDKLPKETPRRIRSLMKRCLDRDLRTRLRDIREARVAIEATDDEPEQVKVPPAGRSWIAWAIAAGLFALVAAGVSFVHFREKLPPVALISSAILPPEAAAFGYDVPALSPDGKSIVFGARTTDNKNPLPREDNPICRRGL
jgi:serine/threonine-protein kinase